MRRSTLGPTRVTARPSARSRVSFTIRMLALIASAEAIAVAAYADGFDGRWVGRYKLESGKPFFCTPEGDFSAVVSGNTFHGEVSTRFGRHAVPGIVHPDGTWHGTFQLPTGTVVEFHGRFEGGKIVGIYGTGTDCSGTVTGARN